MAWITLSSRIARTLQQVTNMYSCGWHRSLAAHLWLMSVTDTTLFFCNTLICYMVLKNVKQNQAL